jgi:uncharacterized protein (TIGR00725 family)
VVGPAEADEQLCELARAVGRLVAARGGVLLCGGLGGVMAAAAEGAAGEGGLSVGILPGVDRAQGNPHLTLVLATGLGELRNALLVRASDAVIAVGGSWGTLSEIALAVRGGVALISLHGWSVNDATGAALPGLLTAATPLEAVEAAIGASGHAESLRAAG